MKFTSILAPMVMFTAVAAALPSSTTSTASNDGKLSPTSSAAAPPVSSAREPLSNAERLKQGLRLKVPRRRALEARDPAPSPTACGRLLLLASDNSYNGFVASSTDDQGRFFVTASPALALEVVYSNHRLIPTNDPDGYLFGATFGNYYDDPPSGPGNNNFEGDSGNFAVISGTSDTTPYNSPAQSGSTTYTLGPNNGIEAAIFSLDTENNEILPTWINTDGSSNLSFFGMPDSDVSHPLVISQNIGSYNDMNGGYSARMFCIGTD